MKKDPDTRTNVIEHFSKSYDLKKGLRFVVKVSVLVTLNRYKSLSRSELLAIAPASTILTLVTPCKSKVPTYLSEEGQMRS